MKNLGYTFRNLYNFAISLFKVFGKKFSYTKYKTNQEQDFQEIREESEGKGISKIKPAQKYRSVRRKKAKD